MALYEDASLRGDLFDEEAAPLLAWAEGEIARLDAEAADDGVFDARVDALRRLIKAIGRFVSLREGGSVDALTLAFAAVIDHAAAVGCVVPSDRSAAFLERIRSMSNVEVIHALTAQLRSPETPSAESSRESSSSTLSALSADASRLLTDIKWWVDQVEARKNEQGTLPEEQHEDE